MLVKENPTQAPPAKENPGLLRRMLERRRHEETDGDSGALKESALDLADIQGHSPRLQNADGPPSPVDIRNSGTSAQATRPARKRRRIRCPANHYCGGLARGVRARPGDNPTDAPRHKPDYCLNNRVEQV